MRTFVLFIIALLFACPVLAQDQSPSYPSAMPPGIARVSPIAPVQQRLARAQTSYGHALGFVNVTSFGLAGRAYFSLGGRRDASMMELSTGLVRANSSLIADTYLGGYRYAQGLFMIPAYFGMRYDLFKGQAGTMDWSHFVRGGLGPVLGLLTPLGFGFFESLNHTSFHWGAGGYAATGVEFTFDQSYSVFLQAGVDYTGFFRPVGDRTYFGSPSFAIGFGKLIP
ncbi:hypothetical protein EHM92_04535 [bacterium]|nr:MAG: hypothetical protein EHM92_04535 [bacterium]